MSEIIDAPKIYNQLMNGSYDETNNELIKSHGHCLSDYMIYGEGMEEDTIIKVIFERFLPLRYAVFDKPQNGATIKLMHEICNKLLYYYILSNQSRYTIDEEKYNFSALVSPDAFNEYTDQDITDFLDAFKDIK